MGVGFAFAGRQYPPTVGGEGFRIDLLFNHLKLRCYVVIELKVVPFRPEFAGKMNFYTKIIEISVAAAATRKARKAAFVGFTDIVRHHLTQRAAGLFRIRTCANGRAKCGRGAGGPEWRWRF